MSSAVTGGMRRGVRERGAAAAPVVGFVAVARGTHRTRVSEMRLAEVRAVASCPDGIGRAAAPHRAARRRVIGSGVSTG